ncbi:MAG: DUF2007 domain-containing protein [Ferruginibacter sp.]|nr:DUF2007 domain-containing protein [Ferruginibacter sp.]
MDTHTKLSSFDNYFLANLSLGLLKENGIDCYLKDEHIVTIDPLLNPAVGGIKLFVKNEELNIAANIVNEAENQYLKDKVCTICGNKGLEVEHKVNKPTTVWGIIKNKILYGQSTLYSKKYRCLHCKSLFNEIPISLEE